MMGSYGAWGWLALGLMLIAVEVLVFPGGFPLWIGIAALVMAAVTALYPMAWEPELVVFGLLAIAASVAAWRLNYRKGRTDAADSLNARVEHLVGRTFTLDEAISGGFGRIRVDDTVWRVSGADLAAGTMVTVTGVDGATLLVRPAGG